MKIAIEGMDGVGKTTIAQKLAERNNFMYVGNAIHQLFGITDNNGSFYKMFQTKEDEIFLRSGNDILRAWLCSLGNIYTVTQVKDKNIIIDRHILSNFQQNGTKENIKMYQTLLELIGVPDMSVILYASPQTRLERIYSRDKEDKDLKDKSIIADEYGRMIKIAKKFNVPYTVINTEKKRIESIIQEIEEKVIKRNQEVLINER